MPCYRPLSGYLAVKRNDSGKRSVVFNPKFGMIDMPVTVPCGQCIGCRLERSRQWAVRCMHEASLHEENCFLTLTYDPEHLPYHNGLVVSHFQKFMKRLRKRYPSVKFRYYMCGEYGEQRGRPHYHACIFGFDFPDKIYYKGKAGNKLYISPILDEVWGLGQCSIGEVTFESAAYVARYIVDKRTGDDAHEYYEWFDPDTGEIFNRIPEYTTMSRRPGIGRGWFDKYETDVFPRDYVISRGHKSGVPRFYRTILEAQNPDLARRLKFLRKRKINLDDNTSDRLKVKEEVAMSRLSQNPRKEIK